MSDTDRARARAEIAGQRPGLAAVKSKADIDAHRTLHWPHGRADVQRLGGMLGPLSFFAPGRVAFSPLQVAPWADEPGAELLDGLLRRLRGEWPCVPFGRCDRPADLPATWQARTPGDAWPHGYASHHEWHWVETSAPHTIAMALNYPADHAIDRLEREIAAEPNQPALNLRLRVHARRACALPVALHPTFSLGLGRVHLELPGFALGCAYPVPAEPGTSRAMPGATFDALNAVPMAPEEGGGMLDLSRYPLPFDTEELLQLREVRGPVSLHYLDLGWKVSLAIDCPELLPDLMLWVSHRGRRQTPWNGRHLALGVEPVHGVFDLGRVATPPADHALADRAAGLALRPGEPLQIDLRIWASPDEVPV